MPEGADWFLIGAFAAYSGAGGLVNVAISNWCRDKGYGMGSVVGYIPSAVGGRKVSLAHTGSVFAVTPEAMPRWRGWWRIVATDQWGIFFCGALLGMALPAILYTTALPASTDVRGLGLAAALARALAERGGTVVAVAVALISVWILFKAQLDILDGLVRSVTDILWSGSTRVRAWRGGDVRFVYYGVLLAVTVWGLIALSLTQPYILLQLGANVAGVAMVLGSLHILRVNTTLLPASRCDPPWGAASRSWPWPSSTSGSSGCGSWAASRPTPPRGSSSACSAADCWTPSREMASPVAGRVFLGRPPRI